MAEFMRNSDAFTWAMESDPRLRSTVVTVLLLDKSPNWDDVRYRIDLIGRRLPMFRQRVVESLLPAPAAVGVRPGLRSRLPHPAGGCA